MTSRIGYLNKRLTVEAPTMTPDGAGGADVSWTTVAVLWAGVRPVSGDEYDEADGIKGRVTHEIQLRYRSGVTADMRLRQGTRVFAIRAVLDPNERRIWLKCLCEETVR